MKEQKEITYKGFKLNADVWTGQNYYTYYVRSAAISKAIKQELKSLGIKASVRKSTTGSIEITLEKQASDSIVDQVKALTQKWEGSTFDGMVDLEESIEHQADDGNRMLFGSKYIFTQRDWRD